MIRVTGEVLDQIVKTIVDAARPEKILLFGSQVTGRTKIYSDIDLMIIENEPFGPGRSRLQETARIRKALTGFRIPKDILVYSSDEVEKWSNSPNHIISSILKEGKVLYERS